MVLIRALALLLLPFALSSESPDSVPTSTPTNEGNTTTSELPSTAAFENRPTEGEECDVRSNILCRSPDLVCCITHGKSTTTCERVSSCKRKISSWAGTNHHFLYALPESEQIEIIETLKRANVKVVRIIVSTVPDNYKFTNSEKTLDIEHFYVGMYDDMTILDKIDALLFRLHQAGMKAIIALHDRYSLGALDSDAYVQKFDLDVAGNGWDGNANQTLENFYGNTEATAMFDRRMVAILTFKSKSFPGKDLRELSEVISSFNIQNEPMGFTSKRYPGWVCSRAVHLKRYTRIPISTGGGATYTESINPEYFSCPAIDHIGIHTFDMNIENAQKYLREAHNLAIANDKKLVLEKVGINMNKAVLLEPLLEYANQLGIPWLVWETIQPNNFWGFGFWTDDYQMWRVFGDEAADASRVASIVAPVLTF